MQKFGARESKIKKTNLKTMCSIFMFSFLPIFFKHVHGVKTSQYEPPRCSQPQHGHGQARAPAEGCCRTAGSELPTGIARAPNPATRDGTGRRARLTPRHANSLTL